MKGLALSTLSTVVYSLILLVGPTASTQSIAQPINSDRRQEFLSDPLADDIPDPLLPPIDIDRAYSPLEIKTLESQLNQLDRLAQQQLAIGNADQAFDLWLRQARLSRVLGPLQEFETIRRVATLAWNQQRAVEVQILTLRTREIWETVQAALNNFEEDGDDNSPGKTPVSELADNPEQILVSGNDDSDVAVLSVIAQTFATLRDIGSSVAVYQQLIDITTTQNGDATAQRTELAELHLAWFQFADAADVYLALLSEARSKGNPVQETDYLERLVYSYQQAKSITNAVRAQTDLIELYQGQGQTEKLPGLLVAIAQNYRTLNQHQNAIEYYRSAYSTAQRFEQFSFSAQVLQDLGALYQSLALNDEALGAYNLLVPVEEQAYNTYGVMNAYDNIGQLQRRQGNNFEALKAFEKALVLADQLNLRQTYFIEQIESVTQLPANSQSAF
ncbi:MAG: tetratricopeptide repeat protein [Cyanobacteria bacterium P01_F01_bin.53]